VAAIIIFQEPLKDTYIFKHAIYSSNIYPLPVGMKSRQVCERSMNA